MLALRLSRSLAARGIHYGWVMVALTFAYTLFSGASMGIVGVAVVPLSNEFGWSLGEITTPMGLRLGLFGAMAPFAGALLLRYGLRHVVVGAAILNAAGLVIAMAMTTIGELWLGVGILLGVAPGMTALVLGATIASRWFVARRGLVVGILSASSATGTLLFLPTAAWITETYGWRWALAPALVLLLICASLFALFARNYPSELGLPPFGSESIEPPTKPAAGNAIAISFATLRESAGTLTFWVLAGTFFVCGVSSFGLIQPHFMPLCADYGIGAVTSASLIAVIGVCDFIGTLASGWLSDRYDNRWLLAWYYGFRGLSLMWLPYSGFSIVGLSFFAVFYGLDFIATVAPTVKLTAQAFGREKAPLVFGWIFAAHQLGSAIAAATTGLSRDILASYLPAFFAAGMLCILAALAMGLLRKPKGDAAPLPQPA